MAADELTWIIGKAESRLMELMMAWSLSPSTSGPALRRVAIFAAAWRRRFDVMLHMQLSLRASLVSSVVRAPIRVGFDRRARASCSGSSPMRGSPPRTREHVLDSFFGFLAVVGVQRAHCCAGTSH